MSAASTEHTEQTPAGITPSDTPFLCQRPVRLTIYAFFALFLIGMLAFRFLPHILDPTFEKHIARGEVMVGMTKQQVLEAWGAPYTINVSYTKDGIRREEWIFEDWISSSQIKHRYLYFEEDALVGGWYYGARERPRLKDTPPPASTAKPPGL
ncbi:MAG TPA: hypothetical protein VES96_05365 [Nitrospiraceae bacterium]|nr:hypothetical protein [Nitrospiraceae bacterium]